jgi:hypothetical protein
MRKSFYIVVGVLLLFCFIPEIAEAQCAMCKAIPESAQEISNQDITGKGINKGILYIIAIPYILIIGFGLYYFRNKLKPFFISLGILKAEA